LSGTAHFEVFPGGDEDDYRWRLRAANGETVASGEGFTTRHDAHRACADVAATARAASRATAIGGQSAAFSYDIRDIEA
jgi:uncharacterized protein YegP (UPF0339 family)